MIEYTKTILECDRCHQRVTSAIKDIRTLHVERPDGWVQIKSWDDGPHGSRNYDICPECWPLLREVILHATKDGAA